MGWGWIGGEWIGSVFNPEVSVFTPKEDKAVWRRGYDDMLGQGIDYGAFFSHEQLADFFGLEVADFLHQRGPLYRLIQELETEHGRTLVPVTGRGYRIAQAAENIDVSKSRRKRGRRLATRALNLLDATDEEVLQPDERTQLRQCRNSIVLILGVQSIHERRLSRIESVLRNAGLL